MNQLTGLPECIQMEAGALTDDGNIFAKGSRFIVNINPVTKQFYSVGTRRHKPKNFEESIMQVQEALDNDPITRNNVMMPPVIFGESARLKCTWMLPDYADDIGVNDPVTPTIDLFSSYDQVLQLATRISGWMKVCENGLVISKELAMSRHKHTTGIHPMWLQYQIPNMIKIFEQETYVWKQWTSRILKTDEYDMVMETLDLSKKDTEAIEQEVEIRSDMMLEHDRYRTMSVWIFFMLLTQYITHKTSSMKRLRLEHNLQTAMNRLG